MTTGLKLGCIADDFTGATDLANNLVCSGMRVVQVIGVPQTHLLNDVDDVDAVVVALKSRTNAPADAVAQSLAALHWLQAAGAEQIYFKYCSTFDSTAQGNIGPVTEALMAALGTDFTVATPAFPDNGRTVFKGHLFVGDVLLNESGMQNHPLTPMQDPNLVRVLQAQCKGKVGLIDFKTVAQGAQAIRARIQALRDAGVRLAVVDALSNADLMRLGPALQGMPLVTAGSGVAIGLPQNFSLSASAQASQLPPAQGLQAVVSGSCSVATQAQVQDFIARGLPAWAVNPEQAIGSPDQAVADALAWAQGPLGKGQALLVYSTAEPSSVKAVQARFGAQEAGAVLENTLARIALGLVNAGVQQLIVAGGETSGACVQALGVTQMKIGPQIDPGVPWTSCAVGGKPLHLALKSGNFGTTDFFTKAFTLA